MSRAAKLTLASTSLFALSTIVFVHYAQKSEKAVRYYFPCLLSDILAPRPTANSWQAMHAGVVRDVEQQRVKKERQLDFDMQRALEEEYKKLQSVHDGGGAEEKKP